LSPFQALLLGDAFKDYEVVAPLAFLVHHDGVEVNAFLATEQPFLGDFGHVDLE